MSIPIVESFADKNSLSKIFQSRGATLFMKEKDIEIRSKNILGFEDYGEIFQNISQGMNAILQMLTLTC